MNRTQLFSLALLSVLGACGGDAPDEMQADAPPPVDSTIAPIEREPLTEADMVGLDSMNLAVEVPWTQNRINRNAEENAARAALLDAEVLSHESFDRIILTFGTDAPFPGYSIDVVDVGTQVACGDEGETAGSEVAGDFMMILNIAPVQAAVEGNQTVAIETETYGYTRMQEAGPICETENVVTWATGMSNASQIRVLEMRSPPRLVVDVR